MASCRSGSALFLVAVLTSHGSQAARVIHDHNSPGFYWGEDVLDLPDPFDIPRFPTEEGQKETAVANRDYAGSVANSDDAGSVAHSDYAGSITDVSMICGGPEIWNLLTASSTVTSVQNIKWAKMEAIEGGFVRAQELKVKELGVEIESLTGLIAQKEVEQHVKYTSPEQNQKLIEAALGPDSFGGLDVAQQSGCGSVRGGTIRAPRHAFRKSEGLFDAAAEQLFQGQHFRLDGDDFLATCSKLLPQENERSYCTQLCQRFKDSAQRFSDSSVGETTGNLDELLMKREEKEEALVKAKGQSAECSRAWGGISLLRAHIEKLKGEMDERFTILQNAEMALDDAQWELADLEDNLKEEEQLLNSALESLAKAGGKTEKARSDLEAVTLLEKGVQQLLDNMGEPLRTGRARFEAAKLADKMAADLKTAVSAVMVKMELLYEAAVAEPLAKLGLGAESDLDSPSLFAADPAATHAGGLLASSVENLGKYCSETAKPAFAAVKDQVDLAPLCEVGEAGKVMAGLNEAVLSTRDHIKKDLLWVKSWMNPYRDNKKMTKERAEELVQMGEPKGFQEIISVYKATQFFKYLKDWRHGGPHLTLLAQLKDVLQKLEESLKQMEAQIASLKQELAGLTAAREKALQELEDLVESEGLAAKQREEVEDQVMEMREGAARMALELEELEEAVRKAKEAYDAAAVKLVTAHQEGVAALSFKAESFTELEAQSKEAELLVSLIERSLAKAEQSYGAGKAQLAKLRE